MGKDPPPERQGPTNRTETRVASEQVTVTLTVLLWGLTCHRDAEALILPDLAYAPATSDE